MTTEHEASRTLVKSPPELWAECSDAGSLARHLGEFGEITITRLEPETTVAWEGEYVSGTVRIEPSGWGTRVTLTAQTRNEVTESETGPEAVVMVEPPAEMPTIEPMAEEEIDATVEEMPEEPDPVVAPDAGAFRIRWRRMTSRMRGFFRTGETEQAPALQAAAPPEPPVSVPPPAVQEPEVVAATDAAPQSGVQVAHADQANAPGPEPQDIHVLGGKNPDPEVILTAALDSLGQAHHRPFSRA